MNCKNSKWNFIGCVLTALLMGVSTHGFAQEQFFQAGIEFDSNVYKNFGNKKSDFLFRARYVHDKNLYSGQRYLSVFNYQQGVKKFLHENNQDQMIQSFALFNQYKQGNYHLKWIPSFKILIERQSQRSKNLDIDENYILPSLSIEGAYENKKISIALETGANVFNFYANDNFSYVSEWLKLNAALKLQYFHVGSSYTFSLEQFLDISRDDHNHDLSVYFLYPYKPNIRLSYTFSDSNSSIASFSFLKHQLALRLFYDFGERPSGIPLFSVYGSAIVQWSQFPSIFDFDEEGQRFLLTESEGQTFNSIVAKLSYHFSEKLDLELKYTGFSNDLRSQQTEYSRNMFYSGFKYGF